MHQAALPADLNQSTEEFVFTTAPGHAKQNENPLCRAHTYTHQHTDQRTCTVPHVLRVCLFCSTTPKCTAT